MKILLNLPERISILQIIPQVGDFLMLGIVRGLQDKITVKEKEFKEYEIQEAEGGAYSWNPEKGSIEKEFEIVKISLIKTVSESE